MYTVLLVDDEKIIREGVKELLNLSEMDLDITTAASAVEAMAILDSRKVDIILIDIRMPQMSGLELYDIILEKWPLSKLIFLTGHLEFDYVYKVHRHARYVLKAEEDEKLLDALRETIQEIENDLLLEQMTVTSAADRLRARYFERMILLKELLDGGTDLRLVSQEMLDRMDADLDLRRDIYLVVIRCMNLRELDYVTRSQVGERMSMLMQKFFFESWRGSVFGYNKNLSCLLLQPKAGLSPSHCAAALEGSAELYQKAVTKNLDLPVSIFIRREGSSFPQAVTDFSSATDILVTMGDDEIRLDSLDRYSEDSLQRELSQMTLRLERLFENQDRTGILRQLSAIRDRARLLGSSEDLFILELYTGLATRLLGYAQKTGFNRDPAIHAQVTGLFDITRHSSWHKAFSELLSVTEHVFRELDNTLEHKNQDAVNQVKSYILANLDGDTSLYSLSRSVHLCPEHLLRLFKRKEGVTILQYINDLKLQKARQLLAETEMPIKDIASALGFTSTGYFGRFFKSKQGMTPNAYREQGGA